MKNSTYCPCPFSLRFLQMIALSLLLCACSMKTTLSDSDNSPRLIDLEGKEHSLGEYYGQHTLVFFWASWCPECIVELSSLNMVKHNMRSRNLSIVAVAINDDLTAVRQAPPVRHAEYPVLLDAKDRMRDHYPIHSLPTAYLLDSTGKPLALIDPEDGKAKSAVTGFREWQSKAGTRAIIDSISADRP